MKKVFLMAFALLGVLFLSGCNQEGTPLEESPVTMEICRLNTSPTLFLYPAIDTNSVSPKFFDNTVYEIIKDGKYLGKFKANRFNHSYLNLSYGDMLEMIITAEDDECYVLKESFRYAIPCKPNSYIIPETRCAENIRFNFFDDYTISCISSGDTIETNNDYIIIDLEIQEYGDFDYFGCSYDRQMIDFDIKELGIHGGVWRENEYYELFVFNKNSRENKLEFVINRIGIPFNSTINCMFFDNDLYIKHYEVKVYPIDDSYNDVGQSNPTFNFTINYRG